MSYNRGKNKSKTMAKELKIMELSFSTIDDLVHVYDYNAIQDRGVLFKAILPNLKLILGTLFKSNIESNLKGFYGAYWQLRDKDSITLKAILNKVDKQISKMPELTPAEKKMLKEKGTLLHQRLYGKD